MGDIVPEKLEQYLDDDEKLVWVREPSRNRRKTILITVQVMGHLLLTAFAVFFAISFPLGWALRLVLGITLVISTNAPLVVWSIKRLPEISNGSDATIFVTDERVGKLRTTGELRQAPICPGLKMSHKGGLLQFNLGERTPVSFGGLNQEEALMVTSVVEGLVQKARETNS